MKVQQYTGPVQAKGVEDTAFYRYCPLLSLNEVGGNPMRFGGRPEEFHEANHRTRGTVPAGHVRHIDARHKTRRRCPRALERSFGNTSDLGTASKDVDAHQFVGAHAASKMSTRPTVPMNTFIIRRLLGAWPAEQDEVSREFVDRMRAISCQGDQGEENPHQLDYAFAGI